MKNISLQKSQYIVAAIILFMFIIGVAVIAYMGRPAYRMQKAEQRMNTSTTTAPDLNDPNGSIEEKELFTLQEVAMHNTPNDCWATINGSVYDLSTWVSRHPGGSTPIENLCGIDGSERFTKKHGGSSSAQAALILLKIGELSQ